MLPITVSLIVLYFPAILLFHWLGDYLFQITLKAYNGKPLHIEKSIDSRACLSHVFYYIVSHSLMYVYCGYYIFYALFLIGISHFLQDRFKFPMKYYMNYIKKNGTDNNWYPVMYIIIDNGYHIFFNTIVFTVFTVLDIIY